MADIGGLAALLCAALIDVAEIPKRQMRGNMLDMSKDTIIDDPLRPKIVAMAPEYATSLPPKVAKPRKPR